jgi:hypothetical protein
LLLRLARAVSWITTPCVALPCDHCLLTSKINAHEVTDDQIASFSFRRIRIYFEQNSKIIIFWLRQIIGCLTSKNSKEDILIRWSAQLVYAN